MNTKGIKEREIGSNPLFLRFLNRELSSADMLAIFARSADPFTSETALKAMNDPPDLEPFRTELMDAVRDIIREGPGEEFKAFVNNYMEPSLIEDVSNKASQFGENVSRTARIKDEDSPWIQGLLCYNVCLYIRAFGLENLKSCRTCSKLFSHKGKYAVYCCDPCKVVGAKQKKSETTKKDNNLTMGPLLDE